MSARGEGLDPFYVEKSPSPDGARGDEEVPTPPTLLESSTDEERRRSSIVEREDGPGARKQAISIGQPGQKAYLETGGRNCIQVCLESVRFELITGSKRAGKSNGVRV